MNIICDKCKKDFWFSPKLVLTVQSGEYEIQYYNCPHCHHKYHILTCDAEMQKLIKKRTALARRIQLARAKKFRESTIKKLIAEMDQIKKTQEAKHKDLKPIGEQILNDMSEVHNREEHHTEGSE